MSRCVATARPMAGQCRVIAVIEGDARTARALAMLLEDWGYASVCGTSAAQIADLLGDRVSSLAAIVADYELVGGETGEAAALELSALAGGDRPFLLTTLNASVERKLGSRQFLRKPFDPDNLRIWLAEHVSRD